MAEFKKVAVIPVIPDSLSGLSEVVGNLWFSWNHKAFELFRNIDVDLWEKCRHNPKKLLDEVGRDKLEKLTKNKNFMNLLENVLLEFSKYMSKGEDRVKNNYKIAYFSAEFGIAEALPVYSGGLGILSGDHIKSASDLNLNLVGVGLLYRKGYFQQRLNRDGWQQDFVRINDFDQMPVEEVKDKAGKNIVIKIDLLGKPLFLKVWRISVGRVSVYMLDSNIKKNSSNNREIPGGRSLPVSHQ